MRSFTIQIERNVLEEKIVVILGDANLWSDRWDSPSFLHKQVAEELRDTLTQCGLSQIKLGITYTADRLSDDNQEITSALDHIYVTNSDEKIPVYFSIKYWETEGINVQKIFF